MTVIFRNEGEIDVRAFSSFGVNVKECDSPIGFFGTGLKYAIAVLLREGHNITVWSGIKRIDFSAPPGVFRGKEFNFCAMSIDGAAPMELGFTTELGKNWEMWAAYRELACNCMDEGGTSYVLTDRFVPTEGTTHVIITGDAFESEHAKRSAIILQTPPDVTAGALAIHARSSSHGYYRGVRVYELNQPSIYTYNLLTGVGLTEDRTVASMYIYNRSVAIAIMSELRDTIMLERILLAPSDAFEHLLDYHGWSEATPSSEFLQVIAELARDRLVQINPSAVHVWKDCTRQLTRPTAMTPTAVQKQMLERAVNFLSHFGHHIDEYPIQLVESLGEGCLGLASEGTIYVTERVFHQGTKQLASTLLEEYLHLKHHYRDCTRELQTFLFDRVISMGEDILGEAL